MHIPFVSMVKFKFLAYFSVDKLAEPVVSHLILLRFFISANTDGFLLNFE